MDWARGCFKMIQVSLHLFLLIWHQVHLRSSSIRSQRLGTPDLFTTKVLHWFFEIMCRCYIFFHFHWRLIMGRMAFVILESKLWESHKHTISKTSRNHGCFWNKWLYLFGVQNKTNVVYAIRSQDGGYSGEIGTWWGLEGFGVLEMYFCWSGCCLHMCVQTVKVHWVYVLFCVYPVCVCVCLLVAQSCQTLWDSMECSSSGASVHGILQARILEWVAMPFSKGSSQSRPPKLGLLRCRQILYCLSQQGSHIYIMLPWKTITENKVNITSNGTS